MCCPQEGHQNLNVSEAMAVDGPSGHPAAPALASARGSRRKRPARRPKARLVHPARNLGSTSTHNTNPSPDATTYSNGSRETREPPPRPARREWTGAMDCPSRIARNPRSRLAPLLVHAHVQVQFGLLKQVDQFLIQW